MLIPMHSDSKQAESRKDVPFVCLHDNRHRKTRQNGVLRHFEATLGKS